MNNVEWSARALADLASLDGGVARRIRQSVQHFSATGGGDIKKLQGVRPAAFRLRVGDYRVIFRIREETIRIEHIHNRREAYRLL